MSYKEATPTASILYAVEIPPTRNNKFANMYRAYERLPADLRARVDAGLLWRTQLQGDRPY